MSLRTWRVSPLVLLAISGCLSSEPETPENPYGALEGEYYCERDGAEACATETPLVLTADGSWGFAGYAGDFTVEDSSMDFDGVGGPASWGAAWLDAGAIRFRSTVWPRPVDAASLAGSYACQDCIGRTPIVLEENGEWSWGASGGSLVRFPDDRVRFFGPSGGPPSWGLATIGEGSLTFDETTYVRGE